jgi:uncharacterized protein (TIGR03083 family)
VVASLALKGGAMEFDYAKLRLAAVEDMTATLAGIAGSEWETPSLCDGWEVRHVPAHLVTGYLFELHQIQEVVAQVGSVAQAAKQGAIQFAAMHEPPSIAEAFERHAGQPEPTGIAAVIPPPELFVDHVIHRFDIALPLGLPTETSEEHLLAALTAMPTIEGFIGSQERARGLRLETTDVRWTWGEGPVVRGPADAILLALSGRPCGLERCEGEGVGTLAATQGVDGRCR